MLQNFSSRYSKLLAKKFIRYRLFKDMSSRLYGMGEIQRLGLIDCFIVSYDTANKQKQYKEPSRKKEANCQWMLE